MAKPGKQPTPSDQQRFSLGFARYSGAAHDGRETHTRLICGTGWRLSDIYDCRSRNRNTARARSPLLIALKSPPVPGNRFRTSGEMEKKEGKKKLLAVVEERPFGNGIGNRFLSFLFFSTHGVSIIDN